MNAKDCRKTERFDIIHVLDAQDRMNDCNIKLKAMATLIAVADLESFGDGHPEGEPNRYGLSCILNDIAAEHEMNIELLRADYDRHIEKLDQKENSHGREGVKSKVIEKIAV